MTESNFLRLIDADATKHRLQGGRIFLGTGEKDVIGSADDEGR